MYYEKWGFMLIFWNLAGVPLSYCHCSLYLANHAPSVYKWNRWALVFLYISYLFVYWVWDTANSQKNRFRQAERGTLRDRTAFPQLPWKEVANPNVIETETGDSILVDGWCRSQFLHSILVLANEGSRSRPENSLHGRPLLCRDLGSHHGVQ